MLFKSTVWVCVGPQVYVFSGYLHVAWVCRLIIKIIELDQNPQSLEIMRREGKQMKHTQILCEMWPFLTTSLHFLFPFSCVHPPKLIVVERVPWRGREWSFPEPLEILELETMQKYRRAEIFLDIRKNFTTSNNLGFSATSRFYRGWVICCKH